MNGEYAYGNWGIVVTTIGITLFFLFKFIPATTRQGRRSGGALIAFFVALFTEMYGFPLTIYLLSHYFGIRIPLDHISGHLLGNLISWMGLGNGWFIVMVVSNLLLIFGIWLISAAWDQVYKAEEELVTDGIYRHVRHPQYTGIFIITMAFMVQWPTFTTMILWPFVIIMYVRLARREEREVMRKFPEQYREYMQHTPMFFPRLKP
ncbi:MAG: isoprenylcysteine carboxylmethyltransferase family protein [Desulfobulbaceae bacterium]|nr:isoprenylcysteine carboxylmethyltransferase family protein [Desulfobulbaceae bacterium]